LRNQVAHPEEVYLPAHLAYLDSQRRDFLRTTRRTFQGLHAAWSNSSYLTFVPAR